MKHLARTTDPRSSHEAAAWFVDCGAFKNQTKAILFVIASAEKPLTAAEIGQRCGLTNAQVCRRSADLLNEAFIHGERVCGILKVKTQTWAIKRKTN